MSLAVLPQALFKDFFSEFNAVYGADGWGDGFASIKKRVWTPFSNRLRFGYFTEPYPNLSEFGWGVLSGPVAGFGCAIVPSVTIPLLIIPALGELLLSMKSLVKSLIKLIQGDTQRAGMYFRDGLFRLINTPCLVLLCVVAIPIELARFFVRCLSSLFHLIKSCFTPSIEVKEAADLPIQVAKDGEQDDLKPAVPVVPSLSGLSKLGSDSGSYTDPHVEISRTPSFSVK